MMENASVAASYLENLFSLAIPRKGKMPEWCRGTTKQLHSKLNTFQTSLRLRRHGNASSEVMSSSQHFHHTHKTLKHFKNRSGGVTKKYL